MAAGLGIAAVELILSIADPSAFNYQLLLFAGGLCGVSISQWGDKKK